MLHTVIKLNNQLKWLWPINDFTKLFYTMAPLVPNDNLKYSSKSETFYVDNSKGSFQECEHFCDAKSNPLAPKLTTYSWKLMMKSNSRA